MLFGAYPPSGPAGSLYQASNSLTPLWANEAGTWRPLIDGHLGTIPVAADFTSSIGTLASRADFNGTTLVTIAGEGGGGTYKIQGVGRPLAAGLGAGAIACLSSIVPAATLVTSTYYGVGIYVARTIDGVSAAGMLVAAGTAVNFPTFKQYNASGNPTVNNDLRPGCDAPSLGRPAWFRAVRSAASTLALEVSYDGLRWQVVGKVAEGENAYDRIGIMGLVHDLATSAEQIACHSWQTL